MSRIKELPSFARPREKLLEKGPSGLKDYELLAILLRTGYQGKSALEVAKRILAKHPLEKLQSTELRELSKLKGVGKSRAATIVSAFEIARRTKSDTTPVTISSAKDIFQLSSFIKNKKKEHTLAFFLDARNQLIMHETISIGTLTAGLLHPRELFFPAIKNHAASLIITHNHPSNDTTPSNADIKLTKRILESSKILGIDFLDHVIVGKKGYYSFNESGLLEEILNQKH